MAGCAAILGREDIVFDEDTLRPDSSDDRTTSTPDVTGETGDAPAGDVNTADANDAGPTCSGVDAACDTDAGADAGCCPGMECRSARCRFCLAFNQGCVQNGNTPCCGTDVCGAANRCIACLEAGATCEITEPQRCCSKQCSPTNGCF